MSAAKKVVIADYDFGDSETEREIIERAGYQLVALQAKSDEELIDHVRDCHAVISQYARIGRNVIDSMQHCQVIARYGIGVDVIDVEAATARHIQVTNVQNYCTDEVADHAIALLLCLARRLIDYNIATHQGEWKWQSGRPIFRIRGRTMGIVSFGRIGRAIAERGKALGLHVIAYDPFIELRAFQSAGVESVGREEIFRRSDFLMMQVPMTPETRHFAGEAELRSMPQSGIVINTGRAQTIDNAALLKVLQEGRLAGAGLDDIEEEPAKRRNWSPSENPLFGLSNVIITPHAAYYSEESIQLARKTAAEETVRVLQGQQPRFAVNSVAARAVKPQNGSSQSNSGI
jgi:D-3-phosphoglycerate dehydrogenase / 2-oxoglutarate reductase